MKHLILLPVLACTLALAPGGHAQRARDTRPLVERINEAIEKGVEYLKSSQKPDGTWAGLTGTPYPGSGGGEPYDMHCGVTAFCVFTLLECGVDPEDPVIQKGFKHLQTHFDPPRTTYECAAYVFAIEAKYMAYVDKARKARNLAPRDRAKMTYKLSGRDKTLVKSLIGQILACRNGGAWRYGSWKNKQGPVVIKDGLGDKDNSSTQYCLLALKAAQRMGIPTQKPVFESVAEWVISTQEADGPSVVRDSGDEDPEERDTHQGPSRSYVPSPEDRARGWPYVPGQSGQHGAITGSMTTAGITSLIICKSELTGTRWASINKGEKMKTLDQAIWDGLAWLDTHWSPLDNPGAGPNWAFYYLYGVERVGVLGELDFIGKHNWYGDIATFLCNSQRRDGAWDCGGGLEPHEDQNTCFALLFLKKATVPVGAVLTRGDE